MFKRLLDEIQKFRKVIRYSKDKEKKIKEIEMYICEKLNNEEKLKKENK